MDLLTLREPEDMIPAKSLTREGGRVIPIDPRYGLCLIAKAPGGPRLAKQFSKTFNRLGVCRGGLLEFWGRHPNSPNILLQEMAVASSNAAAVGHWGHVMLFCPRWLPLLSNKHLQAIILHELAHVAAYAAGSRTFLMDSEEALEHESDWIVRNLFKQNPDIQYRLNEELVGRHPELKELPRVHSAMRHRAALEAAGSTLPTPDNTPLAAPTAHCAEIKSG